MAIKCFLCNLLGFFTILNDICGILLIHIFMDLRQLLCIIHEFSYECKSVYINF
jgi:hypothetical protein